MRNLLASGAAFVALASGSALAADIPVKAPPLPPVVAEWTGFYVGGHAGVALAGGGAGSATDPLVTITFAPIVTSLPGAGVLGGGQFGYNWQFNRNWVFGIEGDGSWTNLKADGHGVPIFPGATTPLAFTRATFESDVDWMASVRGRLGYVWGNSLLYGTAGYAWARFKDSANFICPGATCAPAPAGLVAPSPVLSKTENAWVAGGGAQWKAPGSNWSLGVEYLYYGFNDRHVLTGAELNAATGAQIGFGGCGAVLPCNLQYTIRDPGIHVARFRVDYQLFSPVVAKY